jgi:hypothetical protein
MEHLIMSKADSVGHPLSGGGPAAVAAVGVDGYPLRGRGLRFVLVDELMRRRSEMTVAQLAACLEGEGHVVDGRLSKVISDALRWEVRRGRVVRISRGVYRYAGAPVSTARRIRLFARHCRAWVVAVGRGDVPPPTPRVRRSRSTWPHLEVPGLPPWAGLAWLWSM